MKFSVGMAKISWACRRHLATLVEGQDEVTILEVDAAARKLSICQRLAMHDLALPNSVQVNFPCSPLTITHSVPCKPLLGQHVFYVWDVQVYNYKCHDCWLCAV